MMNDVSCSKLFAELVTNRCHVLSESGINSCVPVAESGICCVVFVATPLICILDYCITISKYEQK